MHGLALPVSPFWPEVTADIIPSGIQARPQAVKESHQDCPLQGSRPGTLDDWLGVPGRPLLVLQPAAMQPSKTNILQGPSSSLKGAASLPPYSSAPVKLTTGSALPVFGGQWRRAFSRDRCSFFFSFSLILILVLRIYLFFIPTCFPPNPLTANTEQQNSSSLMLFARAATTTIHLQDAVTKKQIPGIVNESNYSDAWRSVMMVGSYPASPPS